MTLRRLLCAATLTVLGCTVTPADPVPQAPVVKAFTLSARSVQPGTAVTVNWQTEHATSVTLTDAQGNLVGGPDTALEGSLQWTPTTSTLLLLTARNDRGVKATAAASLTVQGTGGSILFTAQPPVLNDGETATLFWSAPGARSVSLAVEGGGDLDLKGQTTSGAVQVNPAVETAYVLSVDGAQRRLTVARRAFIEALSSTPATVKPGEMVTLKWKTRHAKKVSITLAGRGEIFSVTEAAAVANGEFTDTVPLFPLGGLLSYVFHVEGAGAPVEQTLSVPVNNAPEILTLNAPAYARSGSLFSMSWTTQGADGLKIVSGSQVLYVAPSEAATRSGQAWLSTPAASTDFQLIASRGAASVSQTFTVAPVGATSIATFTAQPSTVATGGEPVTLTWSTPNARHLRIIANGQHTVATRQGPAAETGTVTVYPNEATRYEIAVDNGVDSPLTGHQDVSVTAPEPFGVAGTGPLFSGAPVSVRWTTAAPLVGFPHTQVVSEALGANGFEDISTTGTMLKPTDRDDGSSVISPADFETFLGDTRLGERVLVSINGVCVFAPAAPGLGTTGTLGLASNPPFLLAPLWADLDLGTGAIYWQVVNEAPERTLVIQWNKVRAKGVATSELTFQVRVHQTGVISFAYSKLKDVAAMRTVGIQWLADSVAATAAEGQRVTFFGPKSSPVDWHLPISSNASGFLKLANGYLRVVFDPTSRRVTPSALTFAEALYQPAAAVSTEGEWFEVRNTSNVPVDLAGWTLDFGGGGVHTVSSANGVTVVPAQGTLLMGQADGGASNDNVATQYVYGPALAMSETAGSLSLSNDAGFSTQLSWNSAVSGQGNQGVAVMYEPGPVLSSTDMGTTPQPHALTCDATASFGTHGQKGTPGTPSRCFPYRLEPKAAGYRDISLTGTRVLAENTPFKNGIFNDDENWAPLDFSSAPVPYFQSPVTTLYVGANGWMTATQPGGNLPDNYSNRSKPLPSGSPKGVLAPFWDDLDFTLDPLSGIYTQRFAASADPGEPRAHWIVQWHRFTHYGNTAGPDELNFQVKLFDDGDIEFHYGAMVSGTSDNYAAGSSATVWLENPAGTLAMIVDTRSTPLRPRSAYRFRP